MGAETEKTVGVLFDVENILFAAVNDPDLLGQNPNHVLRASLVAIEHVARTFGVVVTRLGALSLPRANTRESIANFSERVTARRDRLTFAQIMVDAGYEISLVTEGQHAADNTLCRVGSVIAENVETIVVVTGDGEEPFATLFTKLLITTQTVHVISYQYIPRKIKYRKGISYTHIAPPIRELLEGRGSPEEFIPEQERKTAVTRETQEASLHQKLRQSVKTFFRGDAAKVDPLHSLWIKLAITALRDSGLTQARFHELVGITMSVRPGWPDPKPTESTIKVLVSALSATNLFERTEVYVPNDENVAWKRNPMEGK